MYVISRFGGWEQPACGVAVGGAASRLVLSAPPAGCGSSHCATVVIIICSRLSQAVQQAQLLQAQSTHLWVYNIRVWWLGATCLRSGGRRRKPAWLSGSPPRWLRLSPLHCSNNMLLSQPGCAAGTAPAGRVYTHMGMSYQGLVAGGNLLAEWRSEAQAGLSTRRPRRLRPSPLDYCSNDMFLPRPGCAAGIALAGTVHTLIGISYQGLVAGGNLLAGGRSEARAGLSTWRPLPAVALPTALL